MNKLLIKFISLFVAIALNASGLLAVGEALAYFSNDENSSTNSFSAGTLNFSLTTGNDFVQVLTPSQTSIQNVNVSNDGTLDFQYKISAIDFSGGLCNNLILDASLDGSSQYAGFLTGFIDYSVSQFASPEDWIFTVSFSGSDTSIQGQSCNFKFIFEGWQTNLPDNTQGFTDTEEIQSTVWAGYWNPPIVLNEFLPNPSGEDSQSGLAGEWVELYNKGTGPINVENWYIKDAKDNITTITSSNIMGGGNPVISAPGWLVVFMDGEILDNDSDIITLYDENDIKVDSHDYSGSDYNVNDTPGGTNDLAAYLPFDENSGTSTEDKSGNNNNGNINGAIWASGKVNYGLSFDGSNYVGCGTDSSLDIYSDISVEAWIKPTQMDLFNTILAKGTASNNYSYFLAIGTYYNNSLSFQLGEAGGIMTGTIPIRTDEWQHLVGVRQGNKMRTYVNNQLSNEITVGTGEIRQNNFPLEIGKYDGRGYFKGNLDEIKIYNRVLTDDEISEHYDTTNPSSTSVVPENKSYARIPDGTGGWVDPYPTPGAPNKLDIEEAGTRGGIIEKMKTESDEIDFAENNFVPIVATTTTTNFVIEEATTTDVAIDEAISALDIIIRDNIATTTEEVASSTEVINSGSVIASITKDIMSENTTTAEATTTEVTNSEEMVVSEEVIIEEAGAEAEVLGEVVREPVEEIPIVEETLIDETPMIKEEPIALFDGDSAQSKSDGEEPDGEEPLIPN